SRAIIHDTGGSAMLVLSRKRQESVVVGGTAGYARLLTVTVLEIRGGTVRLGFEAATVPVHRWEIWERINAGDPPAKPAGEPAAPVGGGRLASGRAHRVARRVIGSIGVRPFRP